MEEHLSSTIANLHPLFTRNPNDVGCIRAQVADLPLDLLRGNVIGMRQQEGTFPIDSCS